MNNIRVWFSSRKLATAVVASATCLLLAPAANAQQFTGSFSGPGQTVTFGASGPSAVLNMPQVQVSNFNQEQAMQAAQAAAFATPTNGANGSEGNTSYKTGEAPGDAGESGNYAPPTVKNLPTQGPGNNVGMPQMTNGLMAPFSVSSQPIPLYDGLGYGFNASPKTQVYSMPYGIPGMISGLINNLGGGIITTGPVLPVTSTGSVNLNTTLGNGY